MESKSLQYTSLFKTKINSLKLVGINNFYVTTKYFNKQVIN